MAQRAIRDPRGGSASPEPLVTGKAGHRPPRSLRSSTRLAKAIRRERGTQPATGEIDQTRYYRADHRSIPKEHDTRHTPKTHRHQDIANSAHARVPASSGYDRAERAIMGPDAIGRLDAVNDVYAGVKHVARIAGGNKRPTRNRSMRSTLLRAIRHHR
jgi:hypothetical protein